MKTSLSILLAIISSFLFITFSGEAKSETESTLSVEDVFMPLPEETTLVAHAFPMTRLDDTVYYAVDYLVEQSNDVRRSELYAMVSGEDPKILYEIDYETGHAGGISLLESADGYLFWTEESDPWNFRYMDLASQEVFDIDLPERQANTPSPSFQIVGDYLYWFAFKDQDSEATLHRFNYLTRELSTVPSEDNFYLHSPYSRIPVLDKDLNYLTENGTEIHLHSFREDGAMERFSTNLSSISLTAVGDKYVFFADQSLEPRLYLLTRETGEIKEVLADSHVRSIRSAVIIEDFVLIDMKAKNEEALFMWKIGETQANRIAGATEWLRFGSGGDIFGVIPDSEIKRDEHIAGMRVINLPDAR